MSIRNRRGRLSRTPNSASEDTGRIVPTRGNGGKSRGSATRNARLEKPDRDAPLAVDRLRSLAAAAFDSDFYRERYSTVDAIWDPLEHFLMLGWVQGRDPSPTFSTYQYLLQYEDVLSRHLNPLLHYLTVGKDEGRQPRPHVHDIERYLPWDSGVVDQLSAWFDRGYYLELNPELSGSPSLLVQYLILGWLEGRDPCKSFSTHKYLWKYPDVAISRINPLVHYLRVGRSEGRVAIPADAPALKVKPILNQQGWLERTRACFDPEFYRRMYPATRNVPDAFEHYHRIGWLEGKDPSIQFSTRKYLSRYRDVMDAGIEPLYHYVRYGLAEGREAFRSEAVPEDDVEEAAALAEADSAVRQAFDESYYIATYPELHDVVDLFDHYMTIGWKEGKNPSPDFDTSFYLKNEGDIREAGINPFRHYILHGRREQRRGVPRTRRQAGQTYFPSVSVIVPNYNHAEFLPQRFQSIVSQQYPNLELIILDDNSTDNSRAIITAFAKNYDGECKTVFNDTNSGSVFSQWRKGITLAKGELIWICESDDFCDDSFLDNLIYLFEDPSIRIVFGDIQFANSEGKAFDGMTSIRESAQPGIWDAVTVMPAAKWFQGPFGVRNMIANVGGCVFRKPILGDAIWSTASGYKFAGDWFLYLMIAGGGQIAYSPGAKAFFRQHATNTSVVAFDKVSFYKELARLHSEVRRRWGVPLDTTLRFFAVLEQIFIASRLANDHELPDLVSLDALLKIRKEQVHIAISFLNFNVGGGEIFPIALLNELRRRGYMVTAVVQTLETDNSFLRGWLAPDIPVYCEDHWQSTGPDLVRDAAIDVVHSHNIWSELFFSKGNCRTTRSTSSPCTDPMRSQT